MKKILFMVLLGFVGGASLYAQNVDQGKRFFYYQRYNSAKDVLEKLVASNPNNLDAVYWLGQTEIEMKDSAAAKDLYQKTFANNGSAPLILVGIGHIELKEGKKNDATQRFETAISLSKNKDINVVNAVARAIVDAAGGDPQYAIQKLNASGAGKDNKNAESYVLMGDAYFKVPDGGAAVTAYQKALQLDPKMAAAKYETARVYLTQGNAEYFLPAFEEATQIDPNYAPAFYQLYYYWYNRDINKAKAYLDKYQAVADKKPSDDYDRISILYAAKDYQGAINAAKAKITELGDKADPRYYKLTAYSYDESGDSTNAKTYLDQYFTKQTQDAFVPLDYVFRAKLLSKFPGNETDALQSFQKAVDLDTAMKSKMDLMADAAAFAGKIGNRTEQANWLGQIYRTKKDPTNRDLYDWGYANYQAKNYQTADSIFCGIYSQKYPSELFGYLWCARSAAAQDTTMEKGLAVEPYKRLIVFADTARDKYKATLLSAHSYLAGYYANVAKQKDSAVASLQKILELDPDNKDAQAYILALTKPAPKQTAPATKTPATKGTTTKPAARRTGNG
ncbi:MAG: hypothetical protein INR73_16775 [Williamsia sp.]|nr:hypothetical protein [Williamsia sp.]